jgi:oxygen-independent coproporphyrinogen-3 oxidase
MDIEALIAKYDVRVPRYTSYPTAPQFRPAIGADSYRGWLAALPDGVPVSLYLHVPFCAQLCWYCGCHTTAVTRRAPMDAYADSLLAEIDLVAAAIGRRLPATHVHWGGGTPHALPAERMQQVMTRLRNAFALAPDAEIAVEIDPRTADAAVLDGLAAMGVTRASLGVQDFDPAVQRAVNRMQSYEQTWACAAGLRARGVRSINLDLIYGLPHQTGQGFAATVRRALDLAPDRVAVFGYAHVPWMKRHQALIAEADLPDRAARHRQMRAAHDALTKAGYVPIGLDHYARPGDALARAAAGGTLRRNFQGYTTDAAPVLIGLGASAIGSLPQGYVQNAAPLPEYRARLREGRLATVRGVALSAEDALRRDVIEQLMCHGHVDLAATAARHQAGAGALAGAAPALAALAADGVIAWDGRRVAVRPAARVLLRAVAAAFDAYHRPDAQRHAPAV